MILRTETYQLRSFNLRHNETYEYTLNKVFQIYRSEGPARIYNKGSKVWQNHSIFTQYFASEGELSNKSAFMYRMSRLHET